MSELNTCVRLKRLNISGNPLSADAVRRLQEALPGCQIITDADLSMPEPTPVAPDSAAVPVEPVTPEPIPLIPDLPEVHDPALEAILPEVLNVWPGSAGCSLRAARTAAQLLDWGMATELTDDEIYAAMGSYLDTLGDEDFMLFRESFYSVYDASYNLRGENAEGLLSDAGVETSAYPWNEKAFHSMEMLCYGLGPM